MNNQNTITGTNDLDGIIDDLEKKITESTSGGARIGKGDEVWYGTLNKEVILF